MTSEAAIRNVWLKSTFIGGIGLRNTSSLQKHYPKGNILFPQVEMIGKELLMKKAYGLAHFGVGMRGHDEQLGFHMMKKSRIVGSEKNASIELYKIGDRLLAYTKKQKIEFDPATIRDTVSGFLGKNDKSILLTEGMRLNRKLLIETVFGSLKQEKRITHTPYFWIQFLVLLIFPRFLISYIKEGYRYLLKTFTWRKESEFFRLEMKKIFN